MKHKWELRVADNKIVAENAARTQKPDREREREDNGHAQYLTVGV
jgi:hypothetical protein